MRNIHILTTSLAMAFMASAGTGYAAGGATQGNTAEVLQGGVARWSGMDARECGIFGKRYAAIDGVCYYPIGLATRTGAHEIALWDKDDKRTLGNLDVKERECTETEITLDDDTYTKVSDENMTRSGEDRARILKAVAGTDAEPSFSLPLGPPAKGVVTKDRSDFCELRVYNGGEEKSRHTGLDYPIAKGTAVVAAADGTVTLAEEQFFTGNTVVVDHGGGLVTMVFHLSDLTVKEGDKVKRGERLGSVGSTGRSTGPHLHYGARWQNQRIDVGSLIGDPSKLPGVGESMVPEARDTQIVEADSQQPSSEDKAGEDKVPSAKQAGKGDAESEKNQSGDQDGKSGKSKTDDKSKASDGNDHEEIPQE
ncbi:MAG: M23 family metallopeptidase, partial [Dokdonella sp.]